MTTTVDIPADVLQKVMQRTGTRSPEEAINKALTEYASRLDQRDLISLLGSSDTFMTPEELDEMRRQD